MKTKNCLALLRAMLAHGYGHMGLNTNTEINVGYKNLTHGYGRMATNTLDIIANDVRAWRRYKRIKIEYETHLILAYPNLVFARIVIYYTVSYCHILAYFYIFLS